MITSSSADVELVPSKIAALITTEVLLIVNLVHRSIRDIGRRLRVVEEGLRTSRSCMLLLVVGRILPKMS